MYITCILEIGIFGGVYVLFLCSCVFVFSFFSFNIGSAQLHVATKAVEKILEKPLLQV